MRILCCLAAICALVATAPARASGSPLPDAADAACRAAEALACPTYYRDADGDGFGDPATAHRTPLPAEGEIEQGGDCDDADPQVHPGALESYDGRDEDCDGLSDEPLLVVTEAMVDPAAVPDTAGEWLEITNASAEAVRLEGVSVVVGTRSCPLGGTLGAGRRLVVGRSADRSANGGVAVDVPCVNMQLANGGTVVRLTTYVGDADLLDYRGWPVPSGASLSLDPGASTPAANDRPEAWCAARSPLPGGDRGTPGAQNDPCA